MARREERRRLALDVRGLVWQQGKFDAERYIRTGGVAEYRYYPPPDTPAMQAAREAVERERAMHEARGHHGGECW
jgi:hypothetical protein